MNLRKIQLPVLFFIRLSVIVLPLFLLSCGNNEKVKKADNFDYKTSLENANKKLVRTEEQEIESYISRYQLEMNKTGSGLRYLIYKNGNGAFVRKGDLVKLKFKAGLINGTECYNSEKDGIKQFEIGKSGVESGLEEGILLLHKGDKAKFIIPSHLAFGLLGDENKIPKRATLIYDVELIEVKIK